MGNGLETVAEGAEADHEETCPRLVPYAGKGREEAVDALGVDELAHVNHKRGVGGKKPPESFTGVPVMRAGVVGAGDLANVPQQFVDACRSFQSLVQDCSLVRAAPRAAVQTIQDSQI